MLRGKAPILVSMFRLDVFEEELRIGALMLVQ